MFTIESPFIQAIIKHCGEYSSQITVGSISAGHLNSEELVQMNFLSAAENSIAQFDSEHFATIASAAFWASISTVEDRAIHGTVCLASPNVPEVAASAIRLQRPVVVTTESIVSLTTASPGGALLVHEGKSGQVEVWGFSSIHPTHQLCLRILRPGMIAAVINKTVVAIYDKGIFTEPKKANHKSAIDFIAEILGEGFQLPEDRKKCHVLLDLVHMMFHQRHGGTLVVVPSRRSKWDNDIQIGYPISSSELMMEYLNDLSVTMTGSRKVNKELFNPGGTVSSGKSISGALESERNRLKQFGLILQQVASFTAVDGATILQDDLALKAFGSKLTSGAQVTSIVERDLLTDEFRDTTIEAVGGTRHQSAAKFIQANNDSLAFVASQDSTLTLFVWDKREKRVMALRNLHHMIWEFISLSSQY